MKSIKNNIKYKLLAHRKQVSSEFKLNVSEMLSATADVPLCVFFEPSG